MEQYYVHNIFTTNFIRQVVIGRFKSDVSIGPKLKLAIVHNIFGFKGLRIMFGGQNYFWSNDTFTTFSQQILYEKLLLVGLNVMLVLGLN